MKKNTLIVAWAFACVLIPRSAFAFVDLPTLSATFPAMVLLLIPVAVVEAYAFSKGFGLSKIRVLASTVAAGVVAAFVMLLAGRLQMRATENLLYGVFIFGTPTFIDFLYNCTLGSARLIQHHSYFLANVIVIAVFLIPSVAVYWAVSQVLLRRSSKDTPSPMLRRLHFRVRACEYISLVLVSLAIAAYYIYGYA